MRGFGRRKIAWAWLSSQQRRLDGEQTAGSNALPSVLPTLFWFNKGFSLTLALRQTHPHITCCTAVSSSRVLQAPFGTLTRLEIKDWGANYINCSWSAKTISSLVFHETTKRSNRLLICLNLRYKWQCSCLMSMGLSPVRITATVQESEQTSNLLHWSFSAWYRRIRAAYISDSVGEEHLISG